MCIVQCFSFRKNTKFVRLKHKQDFCSCKIHENAKLFFSLNSFAFQRQYNCLTYKLYVDIYSTVTTLIWLRFFCCQDSEISSWLVTDRTVRTPCFQYLSPPNWALNSTFDYCLSGFDVKKLPRTLILLLAESPILSLPRKFKDEFTVILQTEPQRKLYKCFFLILSWVTVTGG